jgi:hypothetical protein
MLTLEAKEAAAGMHSDKCIVRQLGHLSFGLLMQLKDAENKICLWMLPA